MQPAEDVFVLIFFLGFMWIEYRVLGWNEIHRILTAESRNSNVLHYDQRLELDLAIRMICSEHMSIILLNLHSLIVYC